MRNKNQHFPTLPLLSQTQLPSFIPNSFISCPLQGVSGDGNGGLQSVQSSSSLVLLLPHTFPLLQWELSPEGCQENTCSGAGASLPLLFLLTSCSHCRFHFSFSASGIFCPFLSSHKGTTNFADRFRGATNSPDGLICVQHRVAPGLFS